MVQINVHRRPNTKLGPASEIANSYDLTQLAASEILAKSRNLSGAFVSLRNSYSTDHVNEAIRLYQNSRTVPGTNSKLKRLHKKYVAFRPSSKCRAMLKAFISAGAAHDAYRSVWEAHSISEDLERSITHVFELRHGAKDMRSTEAVIEGRNAFETINRMTDTKRLLSALGMI